MPSAFFLVGPTASGKSAVAQHIAERSGQLIVSADSMNIYRGMDIGTAKPSAADRGRVEYAGIDLAEPTCKFSVAAYLEAVRSAFQRNRETIVAGGTGLYIKCLTEGFDNVPPENEELRTELEALDFQALEKRAKLEAPELYARLTEDDRQNRRRLIRIMEKDGAKEDKWNSTPKPKLVGLNVNREILRQRIEQRVESMYGSGLLDEARDLLQLNLSSTALQAIGYAEAFAVIEKKLSIKEAKERTVIRTRQLAKRQMTWFRNQLDVEWIDVANHSGIDSLADEVATTWKKLGAAPVVFD